MGYCEGGDLQQVIRKQNGCFFPEQQVIRWFIQIVMALHYLHERNILHRDLKTQNLFLTKSGLLKVGDFGISRHLDSTQDMASTLVGTPFYMSPEILAGLPYNQKSDIWSLGCCLFELLTLRHPFQAKDIGSLVFRVTRGRIGRIPHCYSEGVSSVVNLLLNHKPHQRPSAITILGIRFIRSHMETFLTDTKEVEGKRKNVKAISFVRRNRAACSSVLVCGERDSFETPTQERSKKAGEPLEELDSLVISGGKMKLGNKARMEKVETGVRSCHCVRHAKADAESSPRVYSESRRRRSSNKVYDEGEQASSGPPQNDLSHTFTARERRRLEKGYFIPSTEQCPSTTTENGLHVDQDDVSDSEIDSALGEDLDNFDKSCDVVSSQEHDSISSEQGETDSHELNSFTLCLNQTLLTDDDNSAETDSNNSPLTLKEKWHALMKELQDKIGSEAMRDVEDILSRSSWDEQKSELENFFGKDVFDGVSMLIWKIKLCQELLV